MKIINISNNSHIKIISNKTHTLYTYYKNDTVLKQSFNVNSFVQYLQEKHTPKYIVKEVMNYEY